MAVQRISERKLRRCEAVSGARYAYGFANGTNPHGWIRCTLAGAVQDGPANWDLVNWRTGEWRPYVRNGQFVGATAT